jgi:hypothetical protein
MSSIQIPIQMRDARKMILMGLFVSERDEGRNPTEEKPVAGVPRCRRLACVVLPLHSMFYTLKVYIQYVIRHRVVILSDTTRLDHATLLMQCHMNHALRFVGG